MAWSPLSLMARNNAWANVVLLSACARLAPGEWEAPRTGFFPSLKATLEHVHAVDLYYLDALEGGGIGRAIFDAAPGFAGVSALMAAQAATDARLIRLADTDDPARVVTTDRGRHGVVRETAGAILLHLFQHQVHHRGQAHAMLSSTSVTPPQLDDFHLAFMRDPAAQRMLDA
ncbi:MAG: DinB family protein [Gemmobacter sp.]